MEMADEMRLDRSEQNPALIMIVWDFSYSSMATKSEVAEFAARSGAPI